MSFKLAARAVAVFSLPIRTGHSFWSLSRIQAPQRLFTGTFNYAASTEQQEALEKRRAKWREYARAWWERLKSDPEAYEKVRRKNRQYHQKLRENPRTDPTSLEKAKAKLDRHRKFNQITWATSESSRKNRKLYDWVTRVVANKTQVVWTTHKPVITTERVEHDCATCHRAYHNGVKLWWKRLSHRSEPKDSSPEEPAVYDCHNCFAKAWPENGMPKNYEYRTDKGGHQRLTRLW
ncbi:hypothetical protein VTO58DRAFT_105131 [Aureobasidium pullulans]